jgi:hypothetical protein
LTAGADHAFVSGVHLAVTVGAVLALVSSGIVFRYLPHSLTPGGALRGPVGSLEDIAELGLGECRRSSPTTSETRRTSRSRDYDRSRISPAARSPERTAPSIAPWDVVEVSVPAQCTRPNG